MGTNRIRISRHMPRHIESMARAIRNLPTAIPKGRASVAIRRDLFLMSWDMKGALAGVAIDPAPGIIATSRTCMVGRWGGDVENGDVDCPTASAELLSIIEQCSPPREWLAQVGPLLMDGKGLDPMAKLRLAARLATIG